MPINTDLNTSPYFDDYDEKNDYYKILFKPGVAVQVRELNQLQTILQTQIERFGDNIYRRGTIIDGCNLTFHRYLPYVKINDVETDGTPVNVSAYKGYSVKNTSGLKARILETADGYQANDPDLNTLFIKYGNHGSSGTETAFSPNQILDVYNSSLPVEDVDIITKSSGFSNNDIPVFLSAIAIQNKNGGQTYVNSQGQACNFVVGEIIRQNVSNARAEIREVNATANTTHLILKIRPLATELRIGNAASWSFGEKYEITSSTSDITAKVADVIGSGAAGSIITDTNGGITTLIVTQGGKGYYVEPYVTAQYRTRNTSSAVVPLINALNIKAKNYLAKVTVNELETAVGEGVGLTVSEGIIYQKGYFSRVNTDFVVVEKYSLYTNNVVGFDTTEQIIDYKTDFTLFDNAVGTYNENAPGANRLRLTPKLVAITKEEADANDEFFSIVEFSEGQPFKKNTTTEFNSINKEFAQRTAEESGDYVIDKFYCRTTGQGTTESFASEAEYFEFTIDPGLAYIDGYRVQTTDTYQKDISKGIDTRIKDTTISMHYGNYIKIKELGGIFKFSTGASISLRSAAATYLTRAVGTSQFGALSSYMSGSEIGTARIRSLVLVSGEAGDPDAKYYLYLFDVRMNQGKNFKDVKSIYYNGSGTSDGIADIVLDNGKAVIYDAKNTALLYYSGQNALKNANNITYSYRTINPSTTCSTAGKLSVSVAANPGEYFDYNNTLSDTQKLSVIVTPLSNAICVNISGYVATTSSCTSITGTTTAFASNFAPGDYIRIANSTAAEIKRIASITSSTAMTVTTAVANSFLNANVSLVFPQYTPIPLYLRDSRTATVTGSTTLNIDLGQTLVSAVNMAVCYNAQRTVSASAKTVTRQVFVKINTTSNIGKTQGPWCLGIPDIIRLRAVYKGNGSGVTSDDEDVTSNFWIDHNQNKDYYGVGYLYKNASFALDSGIYLLVAFDILECKEQGVKTVASYPVNDTIVLSESDNTINTLEIPEMYDNTGAYYDLRDYFDFRPYSNKTATIATTEASATLNPLEPTTSNRFSTVTDYKFPVPRGDCTATLERYLGRVDAIVLTSNGDFKVYNGRPSTSPVNPDIPKEGLLINYLKIPPYPSLPSTNSEETRIFLDKKIANIKLTTKRQTDYKVNLPLSDSDLAFSQPRRYTMADIGSLERRIESLEYYVSLGFTEDKINSLQIPSSVDTNTNRFKFGFFVDNFTTTNFSEIEDPNYKASIHDYELVPARKQIKISYRINLNDDQTLECLQGNKILLPSTPKRLIGQGFATESTDVNVTITETVTTVTGTKQTYKTSKTLSKVEYEKIAETQTSNDIDRTEIVPIEDKIHTRSGEHYHSWAIPTITDSQKGFQVGLKSGVIYAKGTYDKGKVHLPILYRKKIDGTWEEVKTATRVTKWTYGDYSTSNPKWEIVYNYTPDTDPKNEIRRYFRIYQSSYSQRSGYLEGRWPQTREKVIYKAKTTTSTSETSKTETTYTKDEDVTEKSTVTSHSIFVSKPLMFVDNLFNTADHLNSPFVDLTKAIQKEINS